MQMTSQVVLRKADFKRGFMAIAQASGLLNRSIIGNKAFDDSYLLRFSSPQLSKVPRLLDKRVIAQTKPMHGVERNGSTVGFALGSVRSTPAAAF